MQYKIKQKIIKNVAIGKMLVLALIVSVNTYAFDKTYNLTIKEFEELQITSNGVTINNFSLGEKRAFLSPKLRNVDVSFSIRNRNEKHHVLNVMVVGMQGNEIIWALDVAPLMSIIDGNKTENATSDSYVPPGTVNKTERVWVRIVGDF
jgi:hypothetical protein